MSDYLSDEEDVLQPRARVEAIRENAQARLGAVEQAQGRWQLPFGASISRRETLLIMGAMLLIFAIISLVWTFYSGGSGRPPQAPIYGVATAPAGLAAPTCQDAILAVSGEGAALADMSAVDPQQIDQAREAADDVLARHLGFEPGQAPVLASGPALVEAALPSGERQRVWYRLWVPSPDQAINVVIPLPATPTPDPLAAAATGVAIPLPEAALEQAAGSEAVVLLMDEQTLYPIVLYEGVIIADRFAPGCEETFVETLADIGGEALESVGLYLAHVVVLVFGVAVLLFDSQRYAAPGRRKKRR